MTSSRRRQRKTRSEFPGRFLRWWGHELAGLIPLGLRPKNRPSSRMLWVGMENGVLVLWRMAGQKRDEVGRINLADSNAVDAKIAFDALRNKAGSRPMGICLPATQVLRKEVILPIAAAENLTQVLGFELGKQTPYTADQAYYDHRLLLEDRGSNRLHVLLAVTPRSVVDEIFLHFTAWGVKPHAVVVSDELESVSSCLNLLPAAMRPRPSRAVYWLYSAMIGVTLLLFTAMLAIPLWQKREVVIAQQPILTQARLQADAVDDLKREQERLLAEYSFPIEIKLTAPPKVALVEELTRLLPDNTWLQQLDIHGMEITMQGNTSSSTKLIGLFEQSTLLENASFKSPLVKVQGGEDRFQLAVEIKAIDLAKALVTLRDLHEKVKPAKSTGKMVKPPSNL